MTIEKMTRKQALSFAREIFEDGIDLEDGETKQDWIDCYMDVLEEENAIIN